MTEILKHQTIAPHDMFRVILESPYAGNVISNVIYARACVRDSLLRGESPLASHLLYTQPGILDDLDRNERAHGINAGYAWLRQADVIVVYIDHGITEGMQTGINLAKFCKIPVEFRKIETHETVST